MRKTAEYLIGIYISRNIRITVRGKTTQEIYNAKRKGKVLFGGNKHISQEQLSS